MQGPSGYKDGAPGGRVHGATSVSPPVPFECGGVEPADDLKRRRLLHIVNVDLEPLACQVRRPVWQQASR